MSDDELLQLSRKGDEQAFLTLYRRHQGHVFRFALHMSGQQATAEEVTQEVFLLLLAHGWQYSAERGPLQAYLIGVARNKVRSAMRDKRAFAAASCASGEAVREDLLDDLSKEQEIAALKAAILALPPNYREVVVLCDLENLEYAQAAERLGCAVGTVRSRLHRARAILGEKMKRRERCTA